MNHFCSPGWFSCIPTVALVASLFLINSAHAQSGPGNSLLIAGDVNYVAVPHAASFNSLPITVMAWVNTTVTSGQQGLVNKYVANSRNGWNLFLLDGHVRAWYFVSGTRNVWGGGDGLDGGLIADGTWHHVALVVDSSGGSIYVDGIEQQSRLWTGAFGSPTSTQEVRIGSYPGGNSGFVGSIFLDEISVWNTSLSFRQIQTSRNGGVTGLEGSRLAFYQCDESSGNTVADSAPLGGSNHGTWFGVALFTGIIPFAHPVSASPVGITQATLNGIANPNRSVIAAGFQWGPTTSYGSSAVAATLGSPAATSNLFYSLSITGLTFDTTYHFRAFASNSVGVQFGTNQTFRTRSLVETRPASSLRLTAARLNGAVTSLGSALTARFEWGLTTNYGNVTPPVNVPANSTNLPVSVDITGPFQGQTIHFRLVATNAGTRAVGANFSFTIPAHPGPVGVPPLRSTAYGSGGYVEFEPRAEWDAAVPMTIETWVYRQDTNRFETVLAHDANDFPGSYWLGFSPQLRFYRGTNFAEVPRIVPARKWAHVAVSYDGAVARFYVNGEFAGARSLTHTGAGKLRPLRVGHILTGPTNDASISLTFAGNLDEIRLWSVARSETEIRDGLYREVRGEPGLAAVFPRGGRIEEISGLIGSGGPMTEQVLGMMPRDLVVPRSPVSPIADGVINEGTEYLGADLLVLRYPDFPDADDGMARFVRTDNDLFVALSVDGRGRSLPIASVGLFVDTTNGRPALAEFPQIEILAQLDADTNHTVLLNGDGLGGYFACVTPPSSPCTPHSLWQAKQQVCGGEINPNACVEFRVSRALLGSFNEFDGVALGLFNVTGSGDQSFTPEDSLPNSPANWVTMTYGDGSAVLPRVKWNGHVFASPTNLPPPLKPPPLVNHLVALFANDIAHNTRTDRNGRFSFDVPMPTGQSIRGQPGIVSFARLGYPLVCTNCLTTDVDPADVFTNGVLYPALPPGTTGVVQLASADFFLQPPPGTAAITGASPTNPQCGMAVALGGVGGFGQKVTLFGTNLHENMNFYLAPVSATFPNDPLRWTLLPVGSMKVTNDGTSVVVEAPLVPEFVREFQPTGVFIPSFHPQTRWRWVAHDTLFRPGRIEYSIVGDFSIRPPPYPNIHGFNFKNQDSDATLEEFLAGYGFEAYFCVDPVGDCDAHVLNPLYLGWYQVCRLIIDSSGGSCVGFSGTALELFNRLIPATRFDPNALLANGISDAGFPGHYDTSNNGGAFTRPPIPMDIWGQIRQNHGAQTSAEYLLHAVSQLDSDGLFLGDPVARLPELRAGTTAQALCMSDNFERGHCVNPYLVEDNFGGNPDKTRIWIYDNEAPCAIGRSANDPCVTNQFIDIDHVSNTYCCFGGSAGRLLFTVPSHLYTGKRTAPGLTEIPQLLGSLVLVIAGGADARLTAPGGREWGWREDGTFVNNLPGLRAVPILGSSTNRTRGIPLVLPLTNGLPDITMHTRDTNAHIFHVAQGGTMLQLEAHAGQPGQSSRITLGLRTNQIASFRFTPQGNQGNFTPRAGFALHANAGATFQWIGLDAEDGRTQEFRALKDRRAVEYCNETTRPTTHYLRIDAVDGATANNASAVFGPFTVPTGAVHCVVLHEWPRAQTVRSELDLNADGTPEQVTLVTGTEIDTDGDGMPDTWETMHQLNPEAVDRDDGADADPDRDGVTNLGEYLSGTHPRDASSALRVMASRLPGNRVRLSWPAVPGRRYEVLSADELWHVFRPIPGAGFPRTATSTEEFFDDTPSAGASRFYKLRLVP